VASPAPEGITVQALARTTPLSWGEKNYEKEAPTGKLRMDPEDLQGPMVLAAVATRSLPQPAPAPGGEPPPGGKKESRLVVFGDSEFPVNSYFDATSNGELFLNTVNWLAGQEDLVAIRPKSRAPVTVTLTQHQASLIWISSILIAPAAILVLGTGLWFRRRRL
jgi:ABC-type uncharacterized transport system involved in gliding motility auxiliary subunit